MYFQEDLGAEAALEYYDFVDDLPRPATADLEEMISVSKEFFAGLLSWSSGETVTPLSKRVRLIEYARKLVNLKKEAVIKTFDHIQDADKQAFYDAAKKSLLETQKELKEIEENKLEEKKIGGTNSIIQSSLQFDQEVLLSPDLQGLKVSDHPEHLLEKVKEDIVEIEKAVLKANTSNPDQKGQNDDDFYVSIQIHNQSDEVVEINIPEGQIFENRIYHFHKDPSQNLATSKAFKTSLKEQERKSFIIPAFCINENYQPPENEPANMTIFEFDKKGFKNNADLWNWIRTNYNDLVLSIFKDKT